MRDRPARLGHQPDRPLDELIIELPSSGIPEKVSSSQPARTENQSLRGNRPTSCRVGVSVRVGHGASRLCGS
jgi:hypothetical protein